MKTYYGKFEKSGNGFEPVVYVASNRSMYALLPLRSQQLANHSPDGFSWGYGGSGPAQLALAILVDYLQNDERALELYQSFKWKHVAHWQQEGEWTLTSDEIEQFLGAR